MRPIFIREKAAQKMAKTKQPKLPHREQGVLPKVVRGAGLSLVQSYPAGDDGVVRRQPLAKMTC